MGHLFTLGYAFLFVNFRGSLGFGQKMVESVLGTGQVLFFFLAMYLGLNRCLHVVVFFVAGFPIDRVIGPKFYLFVRKIMIH